VEVTLNELAETAQASTGTENVTKALQGVQVQNLTPSIARELGVSAGTPGVVITSVDPSSAAAAAGLDRGDIIQEVNRKPIRNVADYDRALSEVHNQSVLLLVSRDSTTRYVVIQAE
jgi:serine protease Do